MISSNCIFLTSSQTHVRPCACQFPFSWLCRSAGVRVLPTQFKLCCPCIHADRALVPPVHSIIVLRVHDLVGSLPGCPGPHVSHRLQVAHGWDRWNTTGEMNMSSPALKLQNTYSTALSQNTVMMIQSQYYYITSREFELEPDNFGIVKHLGTLD